jgi:hypothetical protein
MTSLGTLPTLLGLFLKLLTLKKIKLLIYNYESKITDAT